MAKQAQHTTHEYRRGDILEANDLDAIVNPVNCVGTMGKGLAQQFAKRYPEILAPYREACRKGILTVSSPQLVQTHLHQPRHVVNLATKLHWRNTSRLEWIDQGLKGMYRQLEEIEIKSVGVPALGTGLGLGRLPWRQVQEIINRHASAHPEIRTVVFLICMPFGAVLAAILRPGVTPELFIWTIYAAISGAIIGVGTIIYLRKTLLQTGITTLAILPDFQDQEHFDSTFSAYSDDQHYVAIEPYTNHGNHAATKRRKRRR